MDDFTGTTTADKISGMGGNDALSGGEGNDTIYSAIDLSVALRTKADEQWDLPAGATLKSKGNNWGIAITADQQSTLNTYLQAGAADNAPDFIDAGGGDDTVVAGRGHDMVQGGLGDDVLWGGGGNDVVDGGDGRDIIYFTRRTRKAVSESDNYQIDSYSRIFHEGHRPISHARLGARRAIFLHGSGVALIGDTQEHCVAQRNLCESTNLHRSLAVGC